MALEHASEKVDEENLKIARILTKMKKAKKGMKKRFAQEEQSYIEITFP
jgi:hypothetical protein